MKTKSNKEGQTNNVRKGEIGGRKKQKKKCEEKREIRRRHRERKDLKGY
jgi:hypothetical protein